MSNNECHISATFVIKILYLSDKSVWLRTRRLGVQIPLGVPNISPLESNLKRVFLCLDSGKEPFLRGMENFEKDAAEKPSSTTEYHLKYLQYIPTALLGYGRYLNIFTGKCFNLFYVMETNITGVIYDKQNYSFEYRIDFP